MTNAELKAWVMGQVLPPPRYTLSIPDRLKRELEEIGFQRIKLRQIDPHPVWTFNGHVGTATCDGEGLLTRLKKVARSMGFTARRREIIVQITGGRLLGVISLGEGTAEAEAF